MVEVVEVEVVVVVVDVVEVVVVVVGARVLQTLSEDQVGGCSSTVPDTHSVTFWHNGELVLGMVSYVPGSQRSTHSRLTTEEPYSMYGGNAEQSSWHAPLCRYFESLHWKHVVVGPLISQNAQEGDAGQSMENCAVTSGKYTTATAATATTAATAIISFPCRLVIPTAEEQEEQEEAATAALCWPL